MEWAVAILGAGLSASLFLNYRQARKLGAIAESYKDLMKENKANRGALNETQETLRKQQNLYDTPIDEREQLFREIKAQR